MVHHELLPNLFRTEYRKIVSVLSRYFGFEHLETAEDIASDTFLTAAETWGMRGIPDNPAGWLHKVARNKALDYIKRQSVFDQKVAKNMADTQLETTPPKELDLSEQNIQDSQLQMLFAICQPVIPQEAQVGLALRILCGFGIEEIADAFLSNKETINKRLFRAKEKLREARAAIAFPPQAEVVNRLQPVLTTLYLLFNEGYYSTIQSSVLRKDLCLEAMRLTLMLIDNPGTNLPAVNALMALMCFHASRFEARVDESGEMIRYEDQDTALWNDELIQRGEYFLNKASVGDEVSRYHLEAGIAYWHTIKTDSLSKWDNILQLYNRLLIVEYSPLSALNRTYALAKVKGREQAIVEAEKLDLDQNHLYHVLLGYLYEDIDVTKATDHLQAALKLAKTQPEKNRIKSDLSKLLKRQL
jgi:RNA polymerase sigma-70 factor (ECF subfamily)